jgi:hypothetical protein
MYHPIVVTEAGDHLDDIAEKNPMLFDSSTPEDPTTEKRYHADVVLLVESESGTRAERHVARRVIATTWTDAYARLSEIPFEDLLDDGEELIETTIACLDVEMLDGQGRVT